jgi:oligoribonuclease NrnB/cAMP/cGMP phosphodiesterase (DHH superfamily)
MKTACVYHSIDLDGWMSAAIVKHWHNKIEQSKEDYARESGQNTDVIEIDFIGYNYGMSIPDLSKFDKVIMVDISFPKEIMIELYTKLSGNFVWIDHHISAIKDCCQNTYIRDLYQGKRDVKFAACELTWQYFFPNKTIPEIVRLLGRYDCFGHKGTNEELKVLEFQYGARSVISNYEDAFVWLNREINDMFDYPDTISYVIGSIGHSIYDFLCTEAKQVYKNGFEVYFKKQGITTDISNCSYLDTTCNPPEPEIITKEYKFICINKERFNPINFGIDYHKDGYDGCACFHYANGKWNFSLYNDNGLVDCSVIAKQYGGGGHAGASGFVTNNIMQFVITNIN